MVTRLDWDLIENRVTKEKEATKATSSKAFLQLVLKQQFPSLESDLAEVITDNAHDRGIDAIYIIEKDETAEVHLLQSKHQENYGNVGKTINDAEVLKTMNFLGELFDKSPSLLSDKNLQLTEAVRRIWDLHSTGKICRYFVTFCTNSSGLSLTAQSLVDTYSAAHDHVTTQVLGPTEISDGLKTEGSTSEKAGLQVVAKEILERSDGDVRGVIASIDALSFIEAISTSSKSGIKKHLFDENLRIFLGLEGGFNTEIVNTALSDDNYLFWYLNNGITITCKNYSWNKGHANPVLKIDSYQIVNGAQTSHSLFEAYKRNPESLENIVLMIRVYATDRADIAEKVAIATNSQARISARDLRANRPVLKSIEAAFKEHGYFFERKRNQHSDRGSPLRVDALKLGQMILAFYLELPEKCKTDSDSIFSDLFGRIYHGNYDINELISLVQLYSRIEELRNDYLAEHGQAPESGLPHQHLVFGHWFILYACRLVMTNRQVSKIPRGQEIDGFIDEAINLVVSAFDEQKAVAHYQVYRSAKFRERLKAQLAQGQLDLFYDTTFKG
jgi:hypothetical protein